MDLSLSVGNDIVIVGECSNTRNGYRRGDSCSIYRFWIQVRCCGIVIYKTARAVIGLLSNSVSKVWKRQN